MLKGKNIVLGITGGIAAYKGAALASLLKKKGADVHVIMTENATEFVGPLTFAALTGNRCVTGMFEPGHEHEIEHISLAKAADLCIVAPAGANMIAKIAGGIADDMLSSTILAMTCPILIAPAMNTNMYKNISTQANISTLRERGYIIVEPTEGRLACGDVGSGKMEEPERLLEHILLHVMPKRPLEGKKVLISAGPTREAIDPVRFITNHSTGKMGYAMAKAAARMGGEVTLVSGPVDLDIPAGVDMVPVVSAEDMFEAVTSRSGQADIIIMTAAVADFTPSQVADEKIKKAGKTEAVLKLSSTKDILAWLGNNKRKDQVICGFSMETENVVENSRVKLAKKNADMIVANSLRQEGAGFGTDTNIVTIITPDYDETLPQDSKEKVSEEIIKRLINNK